MNRGLHFVAQQGKTYKSCGKTDENSVQIGFSHWVDELHLTVIKY